MSKLQLFVRDAFVGLSREVSETAFLAGGALRSVYDGTEVKDYDLFFRTHGDYVNAVEAMDLDWTFERLPDAGRTAVYRRRDDGRLYNLIGFCFASPAETLERFDFRCCRIAAWVDPLTLSVIVRADDAAVADAIAKRLVVVANNGTDRTERRINHYLDDYGYHLAGLPLDEIVPASEPIDEREQQEITAARRAARSRAVSALLERIASTPGGGY